MDAVQRSAARCRGTWRLQNRRPAKFRIAATVATQLDPAASTEDALWAELDRLTPVFFARWRAIRAGARHLPGTASSSRDPEKSDRRGIGFDRALNVPLLIEVFGPCVRCNSRRCRP
jgi:hypothetical protein